ncbi:LysR family transcriptional regulator [Sphingomonas sp. DT-51]|uniref:LysR family transcriptional regulator n=1 Tax=Sphingomonas sp. DT-51 TaxID=3396165 RepID=UPI003F19584B
MSGVQLGDAELRLLRVLDTLLENRSVTRAAASLGLTASAVSHSLRELRELFGDQLLIRIGGNMQPTPRALALEPALRQGLAELRRVLTTSEDFEPATSVRSFSLAGPDYVLFTRLPELVARMKAEAPNIDFRFTTLHAQLPQALSSGQLDAVIAGAEAETALALDRDMMRSRIISEEFCCIVRAGHPLALAGQLDLDSYASAAHVLISTTGGDRGIADEALAEHGLTRRVALTLPSFAAAAGFVAASDMIATVPEAIARAGEARGLVVILKPPLAMPRSDAYLWWHPRFQNDNAHSWWRAALTQAFATKSGV